MSTDHDVYTSMVGTLTDDVILFDVKTFVYGICYCLYVVQQFGITYFMRWIVYSVRSLEWRKGMNSVNTVNILE